MHTFLHRKQGKTALWWKLKWFSHVECINGTDGPALYDNRGKWNTTERKWEDLNLKLPHSPSKSWKPAYHLIFPSSYVRMFPPEVYALPHQNFSKSLALTSGLVRAHFVCLHPPYGTQFPSAFVPANHNNVSETSQNFLFSICISCRLLATHYPAPQIQLLDFGAL